MKAISSERWKIQILRTTNIIDYSAKYIQTKCRAAFKPSYAAFHYYSANTKPYRPPLTLAYGCWLNSNNRNWSCSFTFPCLSNESTTRNYIKLSSNPTEISRVCTVLLSLGDQVDTILLEGSACVWSPRTMKAPIIDKH